MTFPRTLALAVLNLMFMASVAAGAIGVGGTVPGAAQSDGLDTRPSLKPKVPAQIIPPGNLSGIWTDSMGWPWILTQNGNSLVGTVQYYNPSVCIPSNPTLSVTGQLTSDGFILVASNSVGNHCVSFTYTMTLTSPTSATGTWRNNDGSGSGRMNMSMTCPAGQDWSNSRGRCVVTRDRWHAADPEQCSANPAKGNPIYPLMGRKRQVERLGFMVGKDDASLVFDSLRKVPYLANAPLLNGGPPRFQPNPPAALPLPWESSLHKALVITPESVQAYRGAGRWFSFKLSGSSFSADANVRDSVSQVSVSEWRYFDRTANAIETYDASGRLLGIRYADGARLDHSYSTEATPAAQAPGRGFLLAITDENGRSVRFDYDASGRIYQITTPHGTTIGLDYDGANNLKKIRWPDGQVREFIYDHPTLLWALTGVKDENGARHSVYSYDADGRATGTELRADASTSADGYRVTYTDLPAWTVQETFVAPVLTRDHYFVASPRLSLTLPTFAQSNMTGTSVLGSARLLSQDQPPGSGCGASSSAMQYDAAGNPKQVDDFNGNRTCYKYDNANRETVRVEGLPTTASCDTVLQASAQLPAGARKISTEWHSVWRLPLKVSEPGRRTTYVYNVNAECVPTSARLLPDGSRVSVLCSQTQEATTDLDGHLGANALLDPAVPGRTRSWTYNDRGQVLTAKGPRTDVDDTVRYTYYNDTTADHTLGDLNTVTQPLLPPTIYLQYNRAGQVLQSTDPNGVLTVNAYDERQRLRTTTVGGQTTEHQYWPTGLLKRTVAPDGTFVSYGYDDAHRLRTVSDNLGNSITYTLDAIGNRKVEEVKDPANVLRRALGRGIDALGRVQQVTGRE